MLLATEQEDLKAGVDWSWEVLKEKDKADGGGLGRKKPVEGIWEEEEEGEECVCEDEGKILLRLLLLLLGAAGGGEQLLNDEPLFIKPFTIEEEWAGGGGVE